MPTQVESLFEQSLQFENLSERNAFLDRACGERNDLRREIESLLKAYAQGEFLESPAFAPVAMIELATSWERPGSLIGRYKLLEQIGEGGMGLVYMADQTGPVRRRVALKVVKPGMDSRQVLARFEAERQTLALMDHPNIAKVHDAGTTDGGRPYFVMELVRGVPITNYCDEARFTPRARLELFVTVCRAVVHAHQKGIIHRDLKPSNILVTSHDGVPMAKVIDFGIAKAINQHLTDVTLFTGFAQMVGTPLYMSPEQAEFNGLDVDTRSDVYSLGVLLYELLTGHTPFDKDRLAHAGIDEVRRIIREDEPPRPSQKISTIDQQERSTVSQRRGLDERQLFPILRGELDWIVMKCLEKDRSRRYESVSALAQDIERYLLDEPVQACPPTLRYRMEKFLRRHRLGLGVATGVVVALSLGLLVATWQARIAWSAKRLADQRWQSEQTAHHTAEQQRQLAEKHLQVALESVDQLLSDVAEEKLLNEPHMDMLRNRLLKDALSFCEKLSLEESTDPRVQLRTAQTARRVSKINRRLGDFQTALSDSQRAIAILESIDPRLEDRATIDSELVLAHGLLAANLESLLRYEEAESEYKNQILLARKALNQTPTDFKAKEDLALSLRNFANLQSSNYKQDYRSAQATYQEALQLFEALRETLPEDSEQQSNIAAEYHNIASNLRAQGKLAEAETLVRNAIQVQEVAAAVAPTPWQREFLGNHYFLLANILEESSRFELAIESLEHCLDVRTKLWKDHPVVPSYQIAVANTEEDLARIWFVNDLAKATEFAERSVARCEDLAGRFYHCKVYLANKLQMLALIESAKSNSERAVALLERELTIERELHSKNPDVSAFRFNLAGSECNLANIYLDREEYVHAETLYREAIDLTRQLMKDFPESREYYLRHMIVANNLANILDETGRVNEAIEMSREMYQVASALHSKWRNVVEYEAASAESAVSLAWRLFDAGNAVEARALLEMAEPILERHVHEYSRFPFDHIRARWGLARILKTVDPAAAEKILEETVASLQTLRMSAPQANPLRIASAEARFDLADTLMSNTAEGALDRLARSQLAVDEGVSLYREVLKEKGGRFVLQCLRAYEGLPTLKEYEPFRKLIEDARGAMSNSQENAQQ